MIKLGKKTIIPIGYLDTSSLLLEVEAQLAVPTKNLRRSTKIKPLITFVDDDVTAEVKTRLEPIFNSKGIKGNLSVITGSLGNINGRLEPDDIKRLHASGWEMLGHTVSHNNLSQYATDDAGLDYEIRVCKEQLATLGIDMKGFVYPQGYSDERVRRVTSQYADYAFGTETAGTFLPGEMIDTFNIPRIAFGSWTDNNPTINGNSEKNTLAYYKACVDFAQANNMWMIFMTHIVAQDISYDTMLGELIDYIKSKSIDIVSASEGYNMHGNRLFSGDSSAGYTVIDKDGFLKYPMSVKKTVKDAFTTAALITSFEPNRVTVSPISAAFASSNGFPDGVPGTLYTYRIDADHRFNYQKYVNSNGNTHSRRCTDISGSAWTPWYNESTYRLYPSNAFAGNTALSGFNTGVSVCYVFGANTNGTPNSIAGMLTTFYRGSNGNDYQTFKEVNKNVLYMRTTGADGTLGPWEVVSGPIKKGAAAPTINADFVGQDFIDTTNKKAYKAIATGTGANDWVLLN